MSAEIDDSGTTGLAKGLAGNEEVSTASLTVWDHRCVACGGRVADVLWRLGSPRCHECRDLGRRPNPAIVNDRAEAQRQTAAEAARRLTGSPSWHGDDAA